MDVHGRHLRYFVAVAEELHFTRAAERLFISQPALSKQIRMLEHTLGIELFERQGRNVALTPAGSTLLPHARSVLAAWDVGWQAIQTSKSRQAATLTVGMSTSPGRGGLLPAIRSRFAELAPLGQLALRQVGWEDPTAGLADGSSDVGFVWLPLPDQERYRWLTVAEEECLVAMAQDHPLAARERLDFAEMLNEPFLALPPSAGTLRDYWLAIDSRDGRAPVIGAEIASPDETYEALVDRRGICLIAAGNAPSVTRGGVTTRPVDGVPPCTLALAWVKASENALISAYAQATSMVVPPADRRHKSNRADSLRP
jgi:DNA-binding transcriptional LysR family regulator